MMGMPTPYPGGKAFASLSGEAMIFKLEGDAHADALAPCPALHCSTPRAGIDPMRAWVQVPAADADGWPDLAEQALHALREARAGYPSGVDLRSVGSCGSGASRLRRGRIWERVT